MITIFLALAAGGGSFAAAYLAADFGLGWSITCGVVGFLAVQGVVGVLVRKRMKADMDAVQAIMVNGQKAIQAKMQRWQFRPPSSKAAAQREIFEDMKVFVREALKQTEQLARYRPWVPMIDRQMATAQVQLNWMIKEFKVVDELMPKVLMIDPTMAAIKIARMYMLEKPTEEIEKVYRKAVRRLRYNQNVLLAATWSWMLLKRGDSDGAFKVLTEALKNSDNAALKHNHEVLMNNRAAQFTNSGIGDQWYSLLLEEPKTRNPRQHVVIR